MKYVVLMALLITVTLAGCASNQTRDTRANIESSCILPEGVVMNSVGISGVPNENPIILNSPLSLTVDTSISRNGFNGDAIVCYVMREGRTSKQTGLGFQLLFGSDQSASNQSLFSLSCNSDRKVMINQDGLIALVNLGIALPNTEIGQAVSELVDINDPAAVAEFTAPKNTKERTTRIWVQHLQGISGWPIPNVQGTRSNEIRVRCP